MARRRPSPGARGEEPAHAIQLSADRLRRHFARAPEPTRRLVEECSTTIVQEVESLKLLVDEFSQFARCPRRGRSRRTSTS